jgi:hypothetical protein
MIMRKTLGNLLSVAVLLAATLVPADPPEKKEGEAMAVIILGGGKAPGAGQAWIDKNAAALGKIGSAMELEEGYPRVVQSRDIRGLNPGFHIAVAGYCGLDTFSEQFVVIQSAVPGAYFRTVMVPAGTLACPRMKAGSKDKKRYVWVDRHPLRKKPAKKARAIARLRRGERVDLLGEEGPVSEARLNCRPFEKTWLKVKRAKDGKKGWVHGGALSTAPRRTRYQGYVVVHNPKDCSGCGEDWGFFVDDVTRALQGSGVWVGDMTEGDKCVPLGDDRTHPEAALSPAPRNDSTGYVFYLRGRAPDFQAHDMPDAVLRAAEAYFGFDLQ